MDKRIIFKISNEKQTWLGTEKGLLSTYPKAEILETKPIK